MPVSPANHWKLGLFVVVCLATVLALAVWFGARRLERQTFTAYSYFDEPVTGLEIGSPVRFRGMTIGTISDIRVAPDRHHLEVQSAVDVRKLEQIGLRDPGEVNTDRALIPQGLRARIERSFVTGVAFVQTDFFETSRYPIPKYPFLVQPNTVHSVPSSQKTFETGLEDLLVSVPELITSLRGLTDELHRSLESADLAATMKSIRETLDHTREAIDSVQWGSLGERASTTIDAATHASEQLSALVADLRKDDGVLSRASNDIHELATQLRSSIADADLPALARSVRRVADALGDDGGETLIALRRASDAFRALAELLERDPGALLRGRDTAPDPRTRR